MPATTITMGPQGPAGFLTGRSSPLSRVTAPDRDIGRHRSVYLMPPSRRRTQAASIQWTEVLAGQKGIRRNGVTWLPQATLDAFTHAPRRDQGPLTTPIGEKLHGYFLHDGMNLVAKEFVASRDDEDGVLILSQFAGASRELKDAIIINPYDIEGNG